MLKTIKKSSNKKLGGCAATYRSGELGVYSTCPNSCALKPTEERGSDAVNPEYLQAVLEAVPPGGVAWTYTHFCPSEIPISEEGETCINFSADSRDAAVAAFEAGYPTVVVEPSNSTNKVDLLTTESGPIRMVRCPAEYSNRTCFDCGGDIPLCARHDRNYIIKFTAHGNQAKKVSLRISSANPRGEGVEGGCYGNSGPVRLQWEKTKGSTDNDVEILREFVAGLPFGTKLRHHVVGDFG